MCNHEDTSWNSDTHSQCLLVLFDLLELEHFLVFVFEAVFQIQVLDTLRHGVHTYETSSELDALGYVLLGAGNFLGVVLAALFGQDFVPSQVHTMRPRGVHDGL